MFGFDTDPWTLARIAAVIQRLTGVGFHPGHVWRLLGRLGWSLQRPPAARPSATTPRSPAGAPRSGPGSRGALERGAWICFLDESGVSLIPPVRRTWAPRGTPHPAPPWPLEAGVMAGICCYAPDGSRARLCFHVQPGSYNDQLLIEVLRQLRRFLRGAPVTLIWDNLPAHHSRVLGDWLETQRRWLQVEYLPGYAHDLDPVEGLWPT